MNALTPPSRKNGKPQVGALTRVSDPELPHAALTHPHAIGKTAGPALTLALTPLTPLALTFPTTSLEVGT